MHTHTTRHYFQTVVTSQLGTINNLIQVRKSDFEVFDALQVDSLDSSDTTGQSKGVQAPAAFVLTLRSHN